MLSWEPDYQQIQSCCISREKHIIWCWTRCNYTITPTHTQTHIHAHTHTHTRNHAHTDTSIHPEKIATACSRQRCLCWHDWCPQSRRPLLLFLHPIKHKSVDMDQDLSAPTECIQTHYIQYIYTETTVDSVVKVFLHVNRLTVRKEMYAQVFSVCTNVSFIILYWIKVVIYINMWVHMNAFSSHGLVWMYCFTLWVGACHYGQMWSWCHRL